jgi:hypothetical protein
LRAKLKVERVGKGYQGLERRVWCLSGEETSDCLRLHIRTASQLGLGEVEFGAPVIEGANNCIDLIDSFSRLFVGCPILGILEPAFQVPFSTRAWFGHEHSLP